MTRQRLWQVIGFLACRRAGLHGHHDPRRGARAARRSRRADRPGPACSRGRRWRRRRPTSRRAPRCHGRTDQRRRRDGGVAGDSGGVLHRWPVRVLPRARHRRDPRRRRRAVVVGATCPVGEPPCAGTWFGIHIPVPQTIVHMSLFVAVLSGLYFTVSTSVDPLYRQRFFDPLIADVRRRAWRAATPTSRRREDATRT